MARTVFVGLSGGVDSAVSAALLKERGFDVVGAFIKIWSPEFIECTWKEDRLDAMRVCAALGVPFEEVDLSEAYKREVVSQMTSAYAKGVTPNPDVLCNKSIKFGHFADWAFENGADNVATGHYARIVERSGAHRLLRGVDVNKDQSYFLYRLEQKQLARTVFPVGELPKPRVRELAARFGLPNAKRPDSQGLCFVGDVSLKEFLSRFIELREGDVVDEHNTVVGSHSGAALYTIGERHGFNSTAGSPTYVTSVDISNNIVHVSHDRAAAERRFAELSDAHWIAGQPPASSQMQAQGRYREEPFSIELTRREAFVHAQFAEPRIVAPGQSLVLYDGDECLGGGIINS